MIRAADDFDVISVRLRELRAEKARVLSDADLAEIKAQVEQDFAKSENSPK